MTYTPAQARAMKRRAAGRIRTRERERKSE